MSYFRTTFKATVPTGGNGTVTLNILFDDGAVVFINGVQVYQVGAHNHVPMFFCCCC